MDQRARKAAEASAQGRNRDIVGGIKADAIHYVREHGAEAARELGKTSRGARRYMERAIKRAGR